MSSPKLSEAAEKIYLKFSEEKGCWTQEENDKTVKPIKAMDSKEVEDELSRRGFHGFSFEAKRLSEELRTGNTATGRSKADKDAINREILRLARKKGHGIPIITQEILDDVLNNDQDLIKMPPSSQEELDDEEELDDDEEEEIRPPWHERKIMNKKTEEKKVLPILSMPILVGEDQSQNIEPAVNTMLTKTIEDLLCQVDHFEDKIQQEKEKLAKGKSKAIFMQISEYKEEKERWMNTIEDIMKISDIKSLDQWIRLKLSFARNKASKWPRNKVKEQQKQNMTEVSKNEKTVPKKSTEGSKKDKILLSHEEESQMVETINIQLGKGCKMTYNVKDLEEKKRKENRRTKSTVAVFKRSTCDSLSVTTLHICTCRN